MGMVDRMEMLAHFTILNMCVIPKQVRDAVSLFHPEKSCMPYCAFGGKMHGPRAFALGYATKDMYLTESLHCAMPQIPLVVADCCIILGLGFAWASLYTEYFFENGQTKVYKNLSERLQCTLLFITSLMCYIIRIQNIIRYRKSKAKFRKWLKARLIDRGLLLEERQALMKLWSLYFIAPFDD